MRHLLAAFVALLIIAGVCRDAEAAPAGPTEERQCQTAIANAERAEGLPRHLLAAIGQVESGRRDPETGRLIPWPWTIDVNGQGVFYSTKEAAVEAALAFKDQGVRSIDVGCVQVNLHFHPQAFVNMQEAFDPQLNADYGARFLKELHSVTRNWNTAIKLYHSAVPQLGLAYWQRVTAVWRTPAWRGVRSDRLQELIQAWAATISEDQ
jgi:Transglycosylase SLT domain